jgi:hypothetical protein
MKTPAHLHVWKQHLSWQGHAVCDICGVAVPRRALLHLAWGSQALCGAVGGTRVTRSPLDVDCPDCKSREPFRRECQAYLAALGLPSLPEPRA